MKHIDKVMPTVATGKPQAGGRQLSSELMSAEQTKKGARDYVDAINQLFAELELAYHNQFHKAYAQQGSLALAKKYWLSVLGEFSPEVIVLAVRKVVRASDYMPTLAALVSACENAFELFGLPSAQAAYVEACCAAEPKAEQQWSHAAVYLAAQHTGWFALASETQGQIFPLFEYNYKQLCQRVVRGERLDIPLVKALPEHTQPVLSVAENRRRLHDLRKQFDL